MRLVVTEKNIAAQKIAGLLATGKPKADKVYNTPCYRFAVNGEEWVSVGLKGHILAVDFPVALTHTKKTGWLAVDKDGVIVDAPYVDESLPQPPFKKKKPFMVDGVDLKGWKIEALPYLVWAPVLKEPKEKEIIRALKNLAKKADFVVIATDFDREGELIGSDALAMVREVAPDVPVSRARYSALTAGEVTKAFENLVELDTNLAAAGETRQHIDLIWGAALTRYLTLARPSGFGNVRSAGRVQTPTLALVVEREKEREAFIPEDYWVIKATGSIAEGGASGADATESFVLTHQEGRFHDEAQAEAAYQAVQGVNEATIVEVTKKARKQQPPAPFNTTSLMAAASAIGLSPARTMRIAESLYMDGLISYPRVDNTVYPNSLNLKGAVSMLAKNPLYASYCQNLLTQDEWHPTRGKQQETDHPPIHPTAPASPESLDAASWKLYNLVARRFLATLGDAAVIEGTKVIAEAAGEPFVTSGDVTLEPGFRAIYHYGTKKEELLPALSQGDRISFADPVLEAKQTEPPARYSQGKLIQEMEKRGLGTKSTRHAIIERLFNVKYLKNDPIEPSQLGMAIIEALDRFAPHITSADMTASLEHEMDEIARGAETQDDAVNHSRAMLNSVLTTLIERTEDMGEAIADAVTADAKVGVCPTCGKDLVVKNSAKTRSSFIGCMGYPDCDVTFPLPTGKIEPLEEPCPHCGAPRVKVKPFRSKAYETCVNPRCVTNQEPDVEVGECPVCHEAGRKAKLIAQRSERTGKRFIRCENYEECGVSYPLPARGKLIAEGKTCPECAAPVVTIETDRGPWEICVNMDCPSKEKKASRTKSRTGTKSRAKKSTTARKTSAAKSKTSKS